MKAPALSLLALWLLSALPAGADVVTAVYTSAADVPVTAASYSATGHTVEFTLDFAPPVGAELMVVNNTGLDFIDGVFTGLAQGQAVSLSFGGVAYGFVANYFGGTGNDLVLAWAGTRLYGWGDNTNGALGDNSIDPRHTPIPVMATGVLAGKTVVSVTAGNHTLALCSDGTLAGWGANYEGQIGDGTDTVRMTPVAVTTTGTPLEGQTIAAVAAGVSHSLALCADGTVAAWGYGFEGQLGDGANVSRHLPVAVKTTGTALQGKTVVAIAAGIDFSLALCSDGTLATWGNNDYGQLGDGTNTSRNNEAVAVNVTGTPLEGRSVVAIAAGGKHSLALCSDGTLVAWGWNGINGSGQVGDGSDFNRRKPVAVTRVGTPLEGKTITAIGAGYLHSLAACSDGTVAAWGYNYFGTLGDSTNIDRRVPVAVTLTGTALAGKTVKELHGGFYHSVALCTDGMIAAWGYNAHGEIGDDTTTTRNTAAAVNMTALTPGTRFVRLARANYMERTFALAAPPIAPDIAVFEGSGIGGVERQTDSDTFAFPDTAVGTASSPRTFTIFNAGTAPLTGLAITKSGAHPGDFAVSSLSASTLAPNATLTFTVTFASKALGARNAVIQIASNDPNENPFLMAVTGTHPTPEISLFEGSGTSVPAERYDNGAFAFANTPLGSTRSQVFTVKNTGTANLTGLALTKTGDNPQDFLLGQPSAATLAPNATASFFITFAPLSPGARGAIIRLASNDANENPFDIHVTGTTQPASFPGARALAWGYNNIGQVGDNTNTPRHKPVAVAAGGVLLNKTIVTLAAGSQHSMALCTDGTLAAWGWNFYGQLGDGTGTSRLVPVGVAGVALNGKTVTGIAAGEYHSLALCSDSTLVAWGNNADGQLGDNTLLQRSSPVNVVRTGTPLEGKTIIAVAAGYYHSLALCSDGTVAGWGFNESGQLGDGTQTERHVPVAVATAGTPLAGRKVVAIAAGQNHNLALCSDGTLVAWGSNAQGQRGDNTSALGLLPVAVGKAGNALAGKTIVAISAGTYHSLALLSDGTVAAWGDGSYGAMGDNSLSQNRVPTAVTTGGTALDGRFVVGIAAGDHQSFAVCSDGSLAGWGYNFYGQVGDDSTTDRRLPVAVPETLLGIGEDFVGVFSGPAADHTLALAAVTPPLPKPEIAIFEGTGTGGPEREDNVGSFAFADTLTGSLGAVQTFTIQNTGTDSLTGISLTKDGTGGAHFKLNTTGMATALAPQATTTFTVQFAPTAAGAKTAAVHIFSNDGSEPAFDIAITGTAIAIVLPTVTTAPATILLFDGAQLNGMVDGKGNPREVIFDYGLTTSYGLTTVAMQSPVANSSAVSATITNLQPHTRYNFRVRAAGTLGAANGANMSFITASRPPVPATDEATLLPGATVSLPVIANDTDPDGDVLTLVSFVPPAATDGKVVKVGNTLTFTAASTFNGIDFNYTVRDAFGASATGTVHLIKGTCLIDPATANLPATGGSYNIDVTATGLWSAIETLPWVVVGTTPGSISGEGDGFVGVLVQPNNSVTPRNGTVMIGGQPHTIQQAAVIKPILTSPTLPILTGIVSGNYSLEIPTTNFPVTYTVTNMPPGLTMDSQLGVLGGKPTRKGTYAVKIKAANAAGTADATLSFTITIEDLPAGLAGVYHGFVERDAGLNTNLGSRFEMTVAGTGIASGRVISGTTALSFTGPLDTTLGQPTASLLLPILRKNLPFLTLDLDFTGNPTNTVSGELFEPGSPHVPVIGWRNIWSTTNKAGAYYRKLHTFRLAQNDPDAALPQGYGYGSWPTVIETTGALTLSGRLPDGNPFTTTTFMGPQGQILIYHPLYANKGSFAGVLDFAAHNEATADNSVVGTPTWFKPVSAPALKDLNYPDGFSPLNLPAEGGAYPIALAGDVVMDLPDNTSDNARLSFAAGGLTTDFDLTLKLYNPGAAFLNKADVPPHSNLVKMPVLTATTGAFSGDFTLPGATPVLNRKVPYQGQIVRLLSGETSGFGYFLLPESTAATAKKFSGSVLLEDAAP